MSFSEWFKYVKYFMGMLTCNGFDVAQNSILWHLLIICERVSSMFMFSLFIKRINQIRKLLWTGFFVLIRELVLLSLLSCFLVCCCHYCFVSFLSCCSVAILFVQVLFWSLVGVASLLCWCSFCWLFLNLLYCGSCFNKFNSTIFQKKKN